MDVGDLLGLNTLLAEFVVALGLAMALGSGYAVYQARRGGRPKGVEGSFRPARAYWLLGVGLVITAWGAVSLVS